MVDYVICAKLIIGVHSRMFIREKLDTNSCVTHNFSLRRIATHCYTRERSQKKNIEQNIKFRHQVHAFSHIFASLNRLIIRINFPTTNDTAVK